MATYGGWLQGLSADAPVGTTITATKTKKRQSLEFWSLIKKEKSMNQMKLGLSHFARGGRNALLQSLTCCS